MSTPKIGLDDYIVAHGADKFACLLAAAKPFAEDSDPRPEIYTTVEIHEMARRVREVLAGVPCIFARGSVLVQEMQEKLSPVPQDALRELFSQHIRFVSKVENRDGSVTDKRVPPPPDATRPVFARPLEPIRQVDTVAEYPVMLSDGRVLAKSGYDHPSKVLLRMPDGLALSVPESPTREQAYAAAARLADLFVDFPLVDDTDPEDGKPRGCHSRSAVVAFLLTVLARPAIAGPTPFFIITKNTPGTGGTLLVETLGLILTGRPFPTSSYPNGNHEEMRKLITCHAVEGRAVNNWDNLVGEIGDAELCRAITSTMWSDRILGGTKLYEGPLTTVQIGSANNARLANDMPRRVLTIRMETDHARPEERSEFKYDLSTYPLAHRASLLSDALTMLRAWVTAGRPQAQLPAWGRFEAWSALVRNVCVFSGLADPYIQTPSRENNRTRLLRTLAAGLEAMDPNGDGMTAAAIVRKLTGETWNESAAVRDAMDASAELMDKVTAVSLGKILGQERNRNLDGIKIVEKDARDRSNVAKWVAVRTEPPAEKKHGDPHRPTPESPASPANTQAQERTVAGDAGDKSGGYPPPSANGARRGGRVQSNQNRGTFLDKGGSA